MKRVGMHNDEARATFHVEELTCMGFNAWKVEGNFGLWFVWRLKRDFN